MPPKGPRQLPMRTYRINLAAIRVAHEEDGDWRLPGERRSRAGIRADERLVLEVTDAQLDEQVHGFVRKAAKLGDNRRLRRDSGSGDQSRVEPDPANANDVELRAQRIRSDGIRTDKAASTVGIAASITASNDAKLTSRYR